MSLAGRVRPAASVHCSSACRRLRLAVWSSSLPPSAASSTPTPLLRACCLSASSCLLAASLLPLVASSSPRLLLSLPSPAAADAGARRLLTRVRCFRLHTARLAPQQQGRGTVPVAQLARRITAHHSPTPSAPPSCQLPGGGSSGQLESGWRRRAESRKIRSEQKSAARRTAATHGACTQWCGKVAAAAAGPFCGAKCGSGRGGSIFSNSTNTHTARDAAGVLASAPLEWQNNCAAGRVVRICAGPCGYLLVACASKLDTCFLDCPLSGALVAFQRSDLPLCLAALWPCPLLLCCATPPASRLGSCFASAALTSSAASRLFTIACSSLTPFWKHTAR